MDRYDGTPSDNPVIEIRPEGPLVSVILPTYNRPNMFKEALRSVLCQTYRLIEVVVINDGGENVSSVIADINAQRPIKYLDHRHNYGIAAARNAGLRVADGKYIAYLDDDDRYYPHHIETLVDFLEGSEYHAAYSDAFRAHQRWHDGNYWVVKRDIPYSRDFDFERLLCGNYIPVLCVMHEKICLDEVGGFNKKYKRLEDWDLWIRMSSQYPMKHLNCVTCEFSWRKDGSSMSSGRISEFRKNYETICTQNRHLLIKKPSLEKLQRERTAEFYYAEARQWLLQDNSAQAKHILQTYMDRYGDHPKLMRLRRELLSYVEEPLPTGTHPATITQKDHLDLLRNPPVSTRKKVGRTKPAALICVTYGDNWQKLSLAINSIYNHTDEPYQLFLIDNASRGETLSLYHKEYLPNTTLVRNPANIWWGGAVNQGIRLALKDDFEYLFFLNDDIEVPAGWLHRLSRLLRENGEIGAVGPLNSSERDWQGYDNLRRTHRELNLPAAQGVNRQDMTAMNAAMRSQGKSWCYIEGMLAFFCAGIKREVIEKAGFLDSDFFPLMCGDDNAYCMEIRKAGYKLALSLDTYVLHHSGFSVNAIDKEKRKEQKRTAAFLLKQKYPEYYGPMVSTAFGE